MPAVLADDARLREYAPMRRMDMNRHNLDDIRVREATHADRDRVLALVPELHAFGPPEWREPRGMTARDRAVLANALDGNEPTGVVFVAVADSTLIGFVHVCEEEDYYAGPCGHIGDIVVAREARGLGVGRLLLAAAERWARAIGYSMLSLNVFVANEHAARVYRSAGFEADTTRYVKILDSAPDAT
jgi:GNAT superfamily N-acetyltransferase